MSFGTGRAKIVTGIVALMLVSAAMTVVAPFASASPILQASPTAGTIDVAGSAGFTDTLSTPGFTGVTFTTTTPSADLSVSPTGGVTTLGTLPVSGSPYGVSGTDTDPDGDTGVWSYSLTVMPDTIIQGSPTSGTTTMSASGTFSVILTATSGIAPITFVTSTTGFSVVGADELKSTGVLSPSGIPYSVTGTDTDPDGDTGTWSFSLTVTPSGGGGSSRGTTTIVQTSVLSASVQSASSGSFTSGPITVNGNSGAVVFVTTTPTSNLSVSSSGLITTTGPLSAGAYSVAGTDSDASGDSGTWTFSLTVTASAMLETVTFGANGGKGVMTPEKDSTPTALSLNQFTWAKHTFVDWNTSASGSGVSYANGALFPFTASTKLFAQWTTRKSRSHTITFASNGGSGVTTSETKSTPTAIRANHFTRAGYTFVDWNTAAKGTGETFLTGATYPFKVSITLFAQWKKIPKKKAPPLDVVTFAPNGGSGSMPNERHRTPMTLTPNHFTRAGYTFLHWNTSPNGSGVSYPNDSTYSFTSSVTLYAQWKKNPKVIPPPPVPKGPQIGPFARGSSALSSLLESQIHSLAIDVRTTRDTQIALTGFGDNLAPAQEANSTLQSANIVLSRARAQSVATYLETQLAALGFTGFSISISAAKTGGGDSGQGANAVVVARLS